MNFNGYELKQLLLLLLLVPYLQIEIGSDQNFLLTHPFYQKN